MARRVLSGFALLVVAALVAAQPAEAKNWENPLLGNPKFKFGAMLLAGEVNAFAQDSVEAPAGYLISRVKLFSQSTVVGAESLWVGFIADGSVVYAAADTITAGAIEDVSRLVIVEGTAEVPGLAQLPHVFRIACDKVYFYAPTDELVSAGDTDGTWYFEAYAVKASSGDGVTGITWP